jgi:hypothetical protein
MTWSVRVAERWTGEIPAELEPTGDDEEQLRRFAAFMDSCRGDAAIACSGAEDFRERRFHQAREEAFHRIGLVLREYRTKLFP